MNSRSLTVTAEYPARFASFESAVVVELVGKDPFGLAKKRALWTRDEVKGVVCYFALELFDKAGRHFFLLGRPWMSL
eukprot:5029007-Pleurochrysis_carterae.AAC.1